jgi:hypothetical protein
MTEADILAQITVYAEQISANMQYWTSVSFGVLVAAHLTKGQVSGVIIAFALIFYAGFTWLMASTTLFQIGIIKSGVLALAQLAESGQTLSLIGEEAIRSGPLANTTASTLFARRAVLLGMFLLTCAYPIYCFYTSKSIHD